MISSKSSIFRFIILFLICMLSFGSYYCFDMPIVLQRRLQTPTCNENVSANASLTCEDCLGMSPREYNLLYAVYSWTTAVVVVCAGFIIDKLGNQVGLFLFPSLSVIGAALFALGAMFPAKPLLLPLMLMGRIVFAAGNGSIIIVQVCMASLWFKGTNLATALGFVASFSRLGSVLNFILTAIIADSVGLQLTLWIGVMLCVFGLICGVVLSILNTIGLEQLGIEPELQLQSKAVKLKDILGLSLQFWLLSLTLMFFYCYIFPFVADASDFIQTKYDFNEKTSAYITGMYHHTM